MDTVFGHCVARALLHEAGIEPGRGVYGDGVSKWEAMRATMRVTPKAMRVATFIVFWAAGMKEARKDSYSITEYQRRWGENERQAYRVQNEFRELWPTLDTPDELARELVSQLEARISKKEAARLPLTLQVEA